MLQFRIEYLLDSEFRPTCGITGRAPEVSALQALRPFLRRNTEDAFRIAIADQSSSRKQFNEKKGALERLLKDGMRIGDLASCCYVAILANLYSATIWGLTRLTKSCMPVRRFSTLKLKHAPRCCTFLQDWSKPSSTRDSGNTLGKKVTICRIL